MLSKWTVFGMPTTAKISLPPLLFSALDHELSNLTLIRSVGFQSALKPSAFRFVGRLNVRETKSEWATAFWSKATTVLLESSFTLLMLPGEK